MTREEWLNNAANELRAALLPEAPKDLLVSVGWPGGRGKKDNTIGQCWYVVAPNKPQVFISPVLDGAERVLDVLLHEMIHSCFGPDTGHRGDFITTCKRVGLVAPWTATTAGEELAATLADIAAKLGDYPHEKLVPMPKTTKQSTRMLKLLCPSCGYTARTTKKWIEVGLPTCPCGTDMEEAQ